MHTRAMSLVLLIVFSTISGCTGDSDDDSSTINANIFVKDGASVNEDGLCGSNELYDCLYLVVNIQNNGDDDFITSTSFWEAVGDDGGIYPGFSVEGPSAIVGGFSSDVGVYFEISTEVTVSDIRYNSENKDLITARVPAYDHYLVFDVSMTSEYISVAEDGPGLCGYMDSNLCHSIEVTITNNGLTDLSTNMFYWDAIGSDGLTYTADSVEGANEIPGESIGQIRIHFDIPYPIFISYIHWEDFSNIVTNVEVIAPLGCTDVDAYNYDPYAFGDDGSCIYSAKIGFLTPLSGILSTHGPVFTWSAVEAIRDLNQMYPNFNFELIEQDSGCDGELAGPAAENLTSLGVIGVVGPACSGASMRANTVLSNAGIPMISYASTHPLLSNDVYYPLFYRVVPSDGVQGPAGADMMRDAGVGDGTLAVFGMTNDYGARLADAVVNAWGSDKLCDVGRYDYSEFQADFSSIANQLVSSSNCTAVYLASNGQDAGRILDALYDAGWGGQVFAGDGVAGMFMYDNVEYQSDLSELRVTQPKVGRSYGNFSAYYDENAPAGGIKAYDLTTYDAVMIMGMAIARDDRDLNRSIEMVGTNFQGASGLINFLSNGDISGYGFDICEYDGALDGSSGDYSCTKYWTFETGIQEY